MTFSSPLPRRRAAFTLIELMVVIGIIALLAGGAGIALRGNNPEASLRNAQGLAMSVLAAARGQAALSQTTARIIVQADSSKADFLRSFRIVVRDGDEDENKWKQVGTTVVLPEGIYIVPSGSLDDVKYENDNGAWTAGRRSTLFDAVGPVFGVTIENEEVLISKDISPLGNLDGGRIVLTAGRTTGPTQVSLFNASAVRGLEVSRYGVASLINDSSSFD